MMGIVSSDDFEKELNRTHSFNQSKRDETQSTQLNETELDGVIIESPNKGRKEGDNNVPEPLRKLIGGESIENGRESALDLAHQFGISASSVSAYSNGAHSTTSYNKPNPETLSHVNQTRDKITKRARARLLSALNCLTPDKINEAKPKEIAGIAKDMSAVIRNMEEKSNNSNNVNGPQFIFYSPQFKSEQSFDVIQSKE